MRLSTTTCLLLALKTITLAEETKDAKLNRPKRDFLFDVIPGNFGLLPAAPVLKEDVKIVRIPGYDQALFRLVPRVPVPAPIPEKIVTIPAPVPERIVQVDPIGLIGSYLGTKSAEETLIAMENMRALMQSGVVKARLEVAPPIPSVYVMEPPIVQQKMPCPEPRPEYPIFERTVLPMPVASPCPLKPAPIPTIPPVPIVPASTKLMPAPPNPLKLVVPDMRPVALPAAYSYLSGYPGASLAFVK